MTDRSPHATQQDGQVTVLVVTYNQAEFVEECLDSILQQTTRPNRILVADDLSTDATRSTIESYLARNPGTVEFKPNDNNLGLNRTLNLLLSEVETEFVTYIAGDDYMMPTRIERQVAAMRGTSHALSYCDASVVNEDSELIHASSKIEFPWPSEPARSQETFALLLDTNWIPAASFFLRTDLLRQAGGYNESVYFEDLELLVRLSALGHSFCYVDEPLVAVRRVRTSLGTRTFKQDNPDFLRAMYTTLQHYETARPDLARRALSKRWAIAKRLDASVNSTRESRDLMRQASAGASHWWVARAHILSSYIKGFRRTR